ncbi:MAG: RDD family protein [Planctomycetaceae bacterium]|nr:RDD family protein [Planctomycetaceae bacterium]
MSQSVDFETPENVQLSYRIAGLGSRFVAWFVDNIFVTLLLILLLIVFVAVAAAADLTLGRWLEDLLESSLEGEDDPQQVGNQVGMIVIGIWMLIWGLGSFVYYFLAELMMGGQTPGKKMADIRVVKSDGFSLDPASIFIRNIFRPVDQFPLFWLVPLLSPNSKRFGDMVGGTIVVESGEQKISPMRTQLLNRERDEVEFRFSASALDRLSAEQVTTLEQFCERMQKLSAARREMLLQKMIPPLVQSLDVEEPDPSRYEAFLLDLMTAEYRRQERRLG